MGVPTAVELPCALLRWRLRVCCVSRALRRARVYLRIIDAQTIYSLTPCFRERGVSLMCVSSQYCTFVPDLIAYTILYRLPPHSNYSTARHTYTVQTVEYGPA